MGIKHLEGPKIPNGFKKKQLDIEAEENKNKLDLVCPNCGSKELEERSARKPFFMPPVYGPMGKTYICQECLTIIGF